MIPCGRTSQLELIKIPSGTPSITGAKSNMRSVRNLTLLRRYQGRETSEDVNLVPKLFGHSSPHSHKAGGGTPCATTLGTSTEELQR